MNDSDKITRIIFIYEDSTLIYEGEDAKKLKEAIDGMTVFCHVHNANPFDKLKLTPKKNLNEASWNKLYTAVSGSLPLASEIGKYFERLRFDKAHHLGLGDIRLTIAQQEEICSLIEHWKANDR